jgi:urea transport system substrate-binding protein
MVLLFVLLLLILVFAMAFSLAETWDQMRGRFIVIIAATALVITGALVGLRYWFTFSTGCVPNCTGANLVGRDLEDQVLSGANFVEANLSGANLAGAQLVGADLSGAQLLAATLEGANLENALLLGTDLTGVNLAGANLNGANLSGADLTGANLTAVDLTQTVLKGAQLAGTELVGVNLSNSDLSAIKLTDANLNGARLNNTNLSGAVLSGADLSGAQLTNSNLSGAWLNRTSLVGADLTNSDLSGSSLVGANLASADLSESSLVGAILVGADLKGSNLNAADLSAVVLDEASLPAAALTLDSKLKELNTLQRGQILVDAHLDGASFDSQTIWPNAAVAERLAGAQETIAAAAVVTETIKVGLLHSLSGSFALSELPIRDALLLAIDEINASSRVLGKTIVPIVADGASDPATFAEKAQELIEEDGVAAIFGCLSSRCRKAVGEVIKERKTLFFFPAAYEGFESDPNIFYMGADASQQAIPALEYLLAQGKTNILLIGSDYIFPRGVNTILKARLATDNLQPVGELYFPDNTTDFTELINQIKITTPQAIITTFFGDNNIYFYQQLAAAGFTAPNLPVLSLTVGEEEIQAAGADVMVGHLIASNYFQTTQTPENFSFVTAFKQAYGEERVTTNNMEAGYNAVYLWKTLVETAQSTTTVAIRDAAVAGRIELTTPEGILRLDGRTQQFYKTLRIGVIRPDGQIDEIFASSRPLRPDPFLTRFPWAEGLEEEVLGQ